MAQLDNWRSEMSASRLLARSGPKPEILNPKAERRPNSWLIWNLCQEFISSATAGLKLLSVGRSRRELRDLTASDFGLRPSFGLRTLDFGLRTSTPAFTLLEIMIVVGIMGIIMTMGVPMVYKVWHRAPMAKALTDIVEVCSNARARAILSGRQVDVIFHPRDGRLEVGSVAAPQPQATPQPGTPDSPLPAAPAPGSGLSAQLVDGMVIRALGINLVDFTDSDSARVRFFPNGTCDEMLMVINSPQNEQRGISLEITTGLASVLSESDLQQLRERLR